MKEAAGGGEGSRGEQKEMKRVLLEKYISYSKNISEQTVTNL
jgi:hypothetical protein